MKLLLISRPLVFLLLAVSLQAQELPDQLRSEIARLQKAAEAEPDSATKTGLEATLKRAASAVAAGRDYLALEELATAHIMARVLHDERITLDKATGVQRFEEAFKQAMPEMIAADQRARARQWKHVPEAIRAIAEISQAKTLVLMEATKPYAAADGPESGMLYIGQARATVETSDFAASLQAVSRKASQRRSILPELHALQTRVNAAFQPPRSIERHSDFIRLNSALKMGFELDASRLYAGAMYRYLEAARMLGMIEAAREPSAERQAGFAGEAAAMARRISASKRDDSLALLFLQKAEAYAAADDWKNAFVILDQALPAYFTAQTTVPAPLAVPAKTVTLTLVRWPYT